jgi:hypothetical protein
MTDPKLFVPASVIAENPMGPDQTWIQLASPHSDPAITPIMSFETTSAGSPPRLVIETADIDEEQSTLQQVGVTTSRAGG